jgi:citronellol/citronellal dehydrogenase
LARTGANVVIAAKTAEEGKLPGTMADAALRILAKPARSFSGHCLIDEEFLRAEGVADFEPYAVTPGAPLAPDILME